MPKKEDANQNVSIARLEERFNALEKNVTASLNRFEEHLTGVVRSFNADKEHVKMYMDERLVTKKEVEPILLLYRRMTDFSLGIVLFVGAIGVAIIVYFSDFIKDKLGR